MTARGERGTPLDVANRGRGLRLGGARPMPGGPPGPGGNGGGPISAPVSFSLTPWTVDKPPTAPDFTGFGTQIGVNAASGQVAVAGPVQIPVANIPIIRSVSFEINNLTPTADVRFTLRANQNPVEGWAPILIFPRNAATITVAYGPDETYVVLPDGAVIDVVAQVFDAGTYDLGSNFHGWFVDVNVAESLKDAYARAGM